MSTETYQEQLDEIAALKAIFSGPDEFELLSPALLQHIESHVVGESEAPPSEAEVTFLLRLPASQQNQQETMEIECALPQSYPSCACRMFVRCRLLPRNTLEQLQTEIGKAAQELTGECHVLPVVQMCQDRVAELIASLPSQDNETSEHESKDGVYFMREYIWFHHIYNQTKRITILSSARSYRLTGVSMPGKPGVVIIEGSEANVRAFVADIKRLVWQKMTSRHEERTLVHPQPGQTIDEAVNSQRAFTDFKELITPHNELHANMSALMEAAKLAGIDGTVRQVLGLDDWRGGGESSLDEAIENAEPNSKSGLANKHEKSRSRTKPSSKDPKPVASSFSSSSSSSRSSNPSPPSSSLSETDLSCLSEVKSGELRLNTVVRPNAKQTEVTGGGQELALRLAAPARDNEANEELVDFIAKLLKTKKKDVVVASGHKSRNKVLAISGVPLSAAISALSKELQDLAI